MREECGRVVGMIGSRRNDRAVRGDALYREGREGRIQIMTAWQSRESSEGPGVRKKSKSVPDETDGVGL